MPDTGWQLLTGVGQSHLSGGSSVTVLDFNYKIQAITTQRVRQPPAGLGQIFKYAGRFGLSQFLADNTGSSIDQVAWEMGVRHSSETNTYLLNVVADTYWWVLPAGLSLYVFFDW